MENTHLDPSRTPPRPPDSAKAGANTRPSSPAPISETSDPLHDIRILGGYRILRRLGEGGMGAVYLGYDGQHGRSVALKVLGDESLTHQHYLDRFFREARSGAQLNHANIVRTFSAGQDTATGKYYLVLEYVDGPNAQALLARQGRLSVDDAVYLALHVARALEHAHSRNIVHRDIKPDNILITRSGVVKLGDLGLAKRTDELSHLTAARQGFGTTAYMPYEQAISARRADARSDIYALGATLYHLLTGEVPFPGDNHLEVIEKKNQGVFLPAGFLEPKVPPALDLILARMLAREPADRYQTASNLIVDLERSRLAATVPSFADADLARQDPWFQAHQNPGEPTRMDPGVVPQAQTPAPAQAQAPAPAPAVRSSGYIVRYKNQAGRAFVARLTPEQIARRIREGTLPREARARCPDASETVAVVELEEVRALLNLNLSSPKTPSVPEAIPESAEAREAEEAPENPLVLDTQGQRPSPVAAPSWQTFLTLIGFGAVAAAALLALARWLLLR